MPAESFSWYITRTDCVLAIVEVPSAARIVVALFFGHCIDCEYSTVVSSPRTRVRRLDERSITANGPAENVVKPLLASANAKLLASCVSRRNASRSMSHTNGAEGAGGVGGVDGE